MSNETPVVPVPTKRGLNGLQWIGVLLIVGVLAYNGFDRFRQVSVEAQGMESEISDVTKKDALYELSMIQNKLKVQGAVTKDFSDREAANVQRNMDSKRAVTMGVMSILGSDLRSVGMPSNGMMQLEHSNEFYKTLMDNAGSEYNTLKDILLKRANAIKNYETFMADPVNRWLAGLSGYPKIDVKKEKEWSIVTGLTKKANDTGVADPINPMGKNADILE